MQILYRCVGMTFLLKIFLDSEQEYTIEASHRGSKDLLNLPNFQGYRAQKDNFIIIAFKPCTDVYMTLGLISHSKAD